jgi:DNA-binding NtrC family response regulator
MNYFTTNTSEEEQDGLHDQTTTKKRILVVDDEYDICMVYQMVLQDAGYECIIYIDPVKALEELDLSIMI